MNWNAAFKIDEIEAQLKYNKCTVEILICHLLHYYI